MSPSSGSGAWVDTKGAHLWRLRDGKVVYLEVFATREGAFAAAGLGDALDGLSYRQ